MNRRRIRNFLVGAALVAGASTLVARSGSAQMGQGGTGEIRDNWGRPTWSDVEQDRQCLLVPQNNPRLGCYKIVAGWRCATWTRLVGAAPRLRLATICVHG